MSNFYQVHQFLFQMTAIYAVLALSFQVVLRTGVFSFAGVGFFGIGGYAGAKLTLDGMPIVPVLLITVVICAAIGYVLALPFVRLRGLYLGMVTVAFDQVLLVVAVNAGSLTGGASGLFAVPYSLNTGDLFLIAAVAILLVSQLERRMLGRSFAAIKTDERLAQSLGLPVLKQRNFIFALGAALGGLAGSMDAITASSFGTTAFDFNLVIAGLTMAVVGGVDSWIGAAIGALFVVWFPGLATSLSGTWQQVTYGGLIILVVTYEPRGVYGLICTGIKMLGRGQVAVVGSQRRTGGMSLGRPMSGAPMGEPQQPTIEDRSIR